MALKLASLSVSNSVNILYPLENRLASYILASYTNEDNNNTENLTQIAEFLGTSYRHLLRVVKEFELETKDLNNKLIINSKQSNLLNELKKNLKECERFYFSVAFINFSGLQLLLDTLKELESRDIKGKIITTTYFQ